MANILVRFLNWYDNYLTHSLVLSAFILYLQITHTISAAECFFEVGGVGLYGFHPITDFLLYGIDLLEAIPLIGITLSIIARVKQKYGLSK